MLDPNRITRIATEDIKHSIGDGWLDAMVNKYRQYVVDSIPYYKFLYYLVSWRKPRIALEIGVEYGLASAHMASAAFKYNGQVMGIDLNFHHVPGKLVNEHYGNYTYILGDSISKVVYDRVVDFTEKYGKIGVVFQDSSHHYIPTCKEWDLYSALLDDDSVWVCDDITPDFIEKGVDPKSMVEYFDERPGTKLKFSHLHRGNVIGIILV